MLVVSCFDLAILSFSSMALNIEQANDHPLRYHLHAIAVRLTPKPILALISLALAAYQHVLSIIADLRYWKIQFQDFLAQVDFRLLLRQLLSRMLGAQLHVTTASATVKASDAAADETSKKPFADTTRTICRLLVEGDIERLHE